MNEHIQRARQIADAIDSPNPEHTLHQQFYDEWRAWEAEDPTRTMAAFDREIGRGNDYTGRVVRFVTGSAARATPFSDGREERTARQVLREAEPEVVEGIIEDLTAERRAQLASRFLADPDTRDALIDEAEGVAVVEAMHHQAITRNTPVAPKGEPLPPPPAFGAKFWRAVTAVQDANAELERFGARGIDARPETRAAAERMAAQAADVRDAVADYVVANITTEEA